MSDLLPLRVPPVCSRCERRCAPKTLVAFIGLVEDTLHAACLVHGTLQACLSPEDRVVWYGTILSDGRRIRLLEVPGRTPHAPA